MKKIILFLLGCFFIFSYQLSSAQTDIKLLENKADTAITYLNKDQDIPKAWELTVEIANIIKAHPEYDDGEIAEEMISLVSLLLTKPWNYASPYITGNKSSTLLHDFIINHINELSSPEDLKVIKKNISKNCDQAKYPFCKKLLDTVEKNIIS